MILKRIGLGFLAVMTVGICVTAGFYPLAYAGLLDLTRFIKPQAPFGELQAHFASRVAADDWGFLFHVCGGMLALLLGPFQFWTKLRDRRPWIHRWIGYGYFTGILVGGLGGLASARQAWAGSPTQAGFTLLALGWLAASGWGLSRILKGQVAEHQAWMRLSYGLTLAAVSLRIQMPLLLLAGFSEVLVYQTVSWSCWVPQLVWWIGWGRRPTQA